MKAWVRKPFKVIPLVLLALVLTACGPFSRPAKQPSAPVSSRTAGTSPASVPSSADTSPASVPSSAGTSPTLSPNPASTAWACVTSKPTGTCPGAGKYTTGSTNSNGYNTHLANNCWADPSCAQTLSANSPSDWQVTSTEPAGNGSVRTGPELQQGTDNWCADENTWQNLTADGCGANPLSDVPISALRTFTSTYAESMPHASGTVAEAAYDIWTNYPSDIMVWTDVVGRCSPGAFGGTQLGTASIGGQNFDVYRYGSVGAEIIFVLNGPGGRGTCAQQPSGTVDILGVLYWVQSHGYASKITVSILDFGFEICSTDGAPATFRVSSYSVTAAAA